MLDPVVQQFDFTNSRQQRLHCLKILPGPDVPIAACLLWHHGFCEHADWHLPELKKLAEAGVAVFTYDCHAHGRSEPTCATGRGLIASFGDLVDDACDVAAFCQRTHGGGSSNSSSGDTGAGDARSLPSTWFVGGYSLGGLVAAHAVMRQPTSWAGLLLVAAALGVKMGPLNRIQASIGGLLNAVVPTLRLVTGVDPIDINPDPVAMQARLADPLVQCGRVRVTTGYNILQGVKALRLNAYQMTLPIWAIHAAEDKVTPVEALEVFCSSVGSSDVTKTVLPGGYHDVLKSPEGTKHAAAMAEWIVSHAGAPKQQQGHQNK